MISFLQVLLVLFIIVYCIGIPVWFIRNLILYFDDKDSTWRSDQEKARMRARKLFLTPIWIIFGIYYLCRWVKEIWDATGFGDDIKKLQKQKEK